MAAVLRRAFAWLRGRAGRRRAAWVALAAFIASAIAGLGLIAGRSASRAADVGLGTGALVVYLQVGTDEAVGRALADDMSRLGGVSRVEYVTPADTLRNLRRALAGDDAILEGVEPGAMPSSIEATLAPGVDQVLPLSAPLAALRRHPAVAQVAMQAPPRDTLGEALAQIAPLALKLQLAAAAAAALLGLAFIRLGWSAPRRELVVATLLGAGPSFHVVPAALAAALAAGVGALAAVGLVAIAAARLGAAAPLLAGSVGALELVGLVVAAASSAGLVAGLSVAARAEAS